MLKMVVFAAMPSAMEMMTTEVKPGVFDSVRTA